MLGRFHRTTRFKKYISSSPWHWNGYGVDYLVFVYSRSLRTREKYTNWDKLKVRQSQNYFFKPTFLPKNKWTNSTLLKWYLRSTCFRSFFWKKLKTPKRHFKINWPLDILTFHVKTLPTELERHLTDHTENLHYTMIYAFSVAFR